MSSQLKEKQQQKDNKRDLEADKIFNQQLFNTLAYAGAGFGAGLVASVFLKHRKALTLLGTGGGALYGASNFMNELSSFNKFKDLAQQGQQPQTLKREDFGTKNWDQFMPKQESLSQQKRYGGSGDDDKSSSESKTRSSKPDEKKKGHEDTSAKPKTQSKAPTEPSQKAPTGKESPSSKPSSGKESDKSSQQSTSQKPSSPKTSSPSSKESSKSSQEQQQKGKEPEKKESKGKEQQQQQRGKEPESPSHQSESKSDSKGQGQHLQDFQSNKGAGKPEPGESRLYRGAERNLHSDKDRELDDLNNQQSRLVKQDPHGRTKKTGNKMKVEHPPENIAGGQFSGKGLTAHSQVNAVIE